MLLEQVESLKKRDPVELQEVLVTLMQENPTAILDPFTFLSLLSGEPLVRPESSEEKEAAMRAVTQSQPDRKWNIHELFLHMGVNDGDPESKDILWRLFGEGVLELTPDLKIAVLKK